MSDNNFKIEDGNGAALFFFRGDRLYLEAVRSQGNGRRLIVTCDGNTADRLAVFLADNNPAPLDDEILTTDGTYGRLCSTVRDHVGGE